MGCNNTDVHHKSVGDDGRGTRFNVPEELGTGATSVTLGHRVRYSCGNDTRLFFLGRGHNTALRRRILKIYDVAQRIVDISDTI